jgi:hypothetical protein
VCFRKSFTKLLIPSWSESKFREFNSSDLMSDFSKYIPFRITPTIKSYFST